MQGLELVVVGLDHSTAGVALRERVAFADAEVPAALEQLTNPAGPPLEQAAILSTCNRVELYGAARRRLQPDELASFLARHHGIDPCELMDALYVHRGDEVPHHLAATAAGMNSLVLGEAQIQGQVRTALEHAIAAGTAGPEVRRLFETAIAAGRRVRSHTGLGRGVASVSSAAVDFVRLRLGTLRQIQNRVGGRGCGAADDGAFEKIAPPEILVLRRPLVLHGRLPGSGRRTAAGSCLVMTLGCAVPGGPTSPPGPHRRHT